MAAMPHPTPSGSSQGRPLSGPLARRLTRPLTVAEFAAFEEDNRCRYELQEGNLVVSPRPGSRHLVASGELYSQLKAQAPRGLWVLQEPDVDLELAEPGSPGFVRVPDLVVVDDKALERVDEEGGWFRASELLLVVEIVSPGSRRMDRVIKRSEYADAGIPRYWIVDIDEPVSVLECHLAEPFGYQDPGDITGEFIAEEPFPLRVQLDQLRMENIQR